MISFIGWSVRVFGSPARGRHREGGLRAGRCVRSRPPSPRHPREGRRRVLCSGADGGQLESLIDWSVNMPTSLRDTDRGHLRRALELAECGRGKVSPNPLVGAVVVRDGEVIGEGFHAELGGLHAERAALADCRERGEDPAGATMYVTLEPCAHEGRQPPCTEALLEAGIGRVVIASEDPSEKAAGRGPGMLRDGGVAVEFAAGAEASAARLLNQPFRKHARTGLPLVTLKLAMSLDGQTATGAGDSPWISGEQSRDLVHRWRAESDAIAVGIGTALADDPLLTARTPRRPPAPPHRLRLPGPPAARLPAPRDPRPVPGPGRHLSRGRRDPHRSFARGRRRDPRRQRRHPLRSHRLGPLGPSAAAASPASSSRAAAPSPPPSRQPPSSTRAESSSPPSSSATRTSSLARVARGEGPRTNTSPAGPSPRARPRAPELSSRPRSTSATTS